MGAGWLQDVAASWENLKAFSFAEVSEAGSGIFGGLFCRLSSTKLGGAVPFRMRHKAIQPVLWGAGAAGYGKQCQFQLELGALFSGVGGRGGSPCLCVLLFDSFRNFLNSGKMP